MKHSYKFLTGALLLANGLSNVSAQVFDKEQYQKALWMTARFYGAQRSGDGHSWLIAEHMPTKASSNFNNLGAFVKGQDFVKDADGSYDLTGGWFDCGDHVKFGQTEFYAGYMLSLGYSEFPGGYDDYYSQNYDGYIKASDYTWEGKAGIPNGIPDILDEIKYATDFFMKCVRDKGTFYYQVGDGDADHMVWCTSSAKATLPTTQGGESDGSRPTKKATGNTSSMTSLCGATLASMARSYKKFDPEYAAKCLEKAKVAYDYVMSTSKGNSGGGSYYPAKDKYEPDIVILCMELYRTTNDATYLAEAKKYSTWMAASKDYNHNFSLCYNNTEDLACYLMAMYGNGTEQANAKTAFTYLADMYKPSSGYFLNKKNDGWGVLRFPANQAFVEGLKAKMDDNLTKVDPYALASIEYIMGSNGRKFSYIVGFGENYPHYPHHRNFYGLDNNDEGNLTTQPKFMQLGYMVGGSLDDGAYTDNEKMYTYSEGGIDYNAGLVSALGYINSILNPVNTNKFGHPTPNLGDSKSICGEESITLDSKVAADGKKTFTWLLDGKQVEKSTSASTYKATKAGVYTCKIDSAGDWETEGSVEILAVLPAMGNESVVLCDPAQATIDAAIEANCTYQWSKDGKDIPGATTATYTITQPGTYKVTASAKGCSSVFGEIEVESKLPVVKDASSASNGKVTLKVESEGEYEWYDAAVDGKLLGTGNTFTTTIKENTKFYVQDAGSASFVAGPSEKSFTGTCVNWGEIGVNFTAKKAMLIKGFKAYIQSVYNAGPMTLTTEISGDAKGTYTSEATEVGAAGWYTFTFSNPIEITGAGDYSLKSKPNNGAIGFYEKGASYDTYQHQGDIIEITGATQGLSSNGAMIAIADWDIQAGSGCGRAVVNALFDANGSENGLSEVSSNICQIYPNPATNELNIAVEEEGTAKVDVYNAAGVLVMTVNANLSEPLNISSLNKGIYTLRVVGNNGVYVNQFVKE